MQVSPGPNTVFHNDVAAINGKERNCCRIGSSAKFATVTPDVESLLNSDPDMQIHKWMAVLLAVGLVRKICEESSK